MDRLVFVALVGLIMGACSAPRPLRSVANPDPSGKIPAIKRAVRTRDLEATRQLVKDLNSDDPAVRFFAIGGLKRLTGQTLGYRYFDDEIQRQPALKRWEQWMTMQENAAGGENDSGGQQDARPGNGGAADAPGDEASEP